MSRKTQVRIAAAFVALSFILPSTAHAINWRYNFQDALKTAKDSQKPVMADFYADWCGWCKKLDAETYSDPDVKKLAEGFICVKIDGDKERELAGKYGVSGYPTILFLDGNGNIIARQIGYAGPADFVKIMNAALPKTGKPAAVKPQEAKRPAAVDRKQIDKKSSAASADSEFVYNGYIETHDGEMVGQINYYGTTSFVAKGDNFREYKVASVDKEKIVLEDRNSRLVMEFKKPVEDNQILGKISVAVEKAKESIKEKVTAEDISALITSNAGKDKEGAAALKEHLGKVAVVFGIIIIILLVIYLYFSVCLQFIAGKTGTKYAWLAWVPVVNLFLMCAIGKIRYWWLLALLVPFVNIIVAFFMWYKIIKARNKPGWLVVLFIIPLVNYIVLGYLAFSK